MASPVILRRGGLAASLFLALLAAASCVQNPPPVATAPIAEPVRVPAVPRVAYAPATRPAPPPPVRRLGPGGPLDRFFTRLDGMETTRRPSQVTVLQFGDSHTAGDRFSGRMRELLQERFGNAGRGILPPGSPFPYFRPMQVSVQMGKEWVASTAWGKQAGPGPFGISSFSVQTAKAGQALSLMSTDPAGFDVVTVESLARPGGGSADLKVDGQTVYRLTTASESLRGARLDVPVPQGARRLELVAQGDGPVELIGWGVGRAAPGIIYESHGTVGATIGLLERWDEGLAAWQLAERDPALIILAFGTNEGFGDRLVEADYEQQFEARLLALKAAAPNADFLIVGPPDANRMGANCTPAKIRARAPGCVWTTPPNVAVVRALQKKIAERYGLRFWDWSLVMGGAGGAHRWAEMQPPLMHTDHVHQKPEGYARSAEALFEALMTDYTAWKSRPVAALPK